MRLHLRFQEIQFRSFLFNSELLVGLLKLCSVFDQLNNNGHTDHHHPAEDFADNAAEFPNVKVLCVGWINDRVDHPLSVIADSHAKEKKYSDDPQEKFSIVRTFRKFRYDIIKNEVCYCGHEWDLQQDAVDQRRIDLRIRRRYDEVACNVGCPEHHMPQDANQGFVAEDKSVNEIHAKHKNTEECNDPDWAITNPGLLRLNSCFRRTTTLCKLQPDINTAMCGAG